MVSWTAILMVLLMVGAVFGLYRYLRFHQKLYNQRDSPQPKEVPAPDLDPWEKEWLENLRNQHHIVSIDQVSVRMAGKVQKSSQGFKAICSCGNVSIGIDLAMSKRLYVRHLKAEGEKAIAAINKFEMPAGIDWMKEFKD